MQMPGKLTTFALGLLVVLAIPALTGCSKDKDTPTHESRQGRVAAINKETGVMEMWIYSPKQKQELRVPGRLDPNVEILINGATATLDDVQVDDKVNVTVRKEKHDGERTFVATKVEVLRPVEDLPVPTAPTP